MSSLLFYPDPSDGGGRSPRTASRRAADPRAMTNTAIAAVIRVAPAALGEQLRQFKTAAQRLFSSKLLAPGFCDTAEAVVLGSPDTAACKAAAFINLVLELQASDSGTSTLKWGLRHLLPVLPDLERQRAGGDVLVQPA